MVSPSSPAVPELSTQHAQRLLRQQEMSVGRGMHNVPEQETGRIIAIGSAGRQMRINDVGKPKHSKGWPRHPGERRTSSSELS